MSKYFLLSACGENGIVNKKLIKASSEASVTRMMLNNPRKFLDFFDNGYDECILNKNHLKLINSVPKLSNGLLYIPYDETQTIIKITNLTIMEIDPESRNLYIIFVLKNNEMENIMIIRTSNDDILNHAKEIEEFIKTNNEDKYEYVIKQVIVECDNGKEIHVLWSYDKYFHRINYKIFNIGTKINTLRHILQEIKESNNGINRIMEISIVNNPNLECSYCSSIDILANNLFVIIPSLNPLKLIEIIDETSIDYQKLQIRIEELVLEKNISKSKYLDPTQIF